MKKWLIGVGVIVVLALVAPYVLIPAQLAAGSQTTVSVNSNGLARFLLPEKNWERWWPGGRELHRIEPQGRRWVVFVYKGMKFELNAPFAHAVNLNIRVGDQAINSTMTILPVDNETDSTYVRWECGLLSGSSPVQRVQQYRLAERIGRSMGEILDSLNAFVKKNGVYGADAIRETSTDDSVLLVHRAKLNHDPSIADVYALYTKMRGYIGRLGARESGRPMLHVERLSDGSFEVMAALPIDRSLPETRDFTIQKLVKGRYLVMDVKGGGAIIASGFGRLQQYAEDHARPNMAITFQSLVTDRSREPDTAKWMTRLYMPVK